MKHYDKVWTEIDLDGVLSNIEKIETYIDKEAQIICVLKSDAYGHGASQIARILEHHDRVWGYAVSRTEEALTLREKGIKKDILVLGYTFPYSYEQLIMNDISISVSLLDSATMLSEYAVKLDRKCRIQLRISSSFETNGIQPDDEGVDLIEKINALPGLIIEGIYGTLSSQEDFDKTRTQNQIDTFKYFVDRLETKLGMVIPLKHCSNSASIVAGISEDFNSVRVGSSLYGICPSQSMEFQKSGLVPVLSLKARIIYVKVFPRNQEIGFEGSFTTFRDTHVATVCIGYGDGYPRSLSNSGYVLVNGQKAYIIGNVCMDQIMVDVTDIEGDVCVGDVVTLIGKDNDVSISVEELSELSGEYNYELVCDFGKRIPRVYKIDDTLISE